MGGAKDDDEDDEASAESGTRKMHKSTSYLRPGKGHKLKKGEGENMNTQCRVKYQSMDSWYFRWHVLRTDNHVLAGGGRGGVIVHVRAAHQRHVRHGLLGEQLESGNAESRAANGLELLVVDCNQAHRAKIMSNKSVSLRKKINLIFRGNLHTSVIGIFTAAKISQMLIPIHHLVGREVSKQSGIDCMEK